MGRLTTHVLDTSLGRPGQGIRIEVYRLEGESRTLLKEVTTNDAVSYTHLTLPTIYSV